MNERKRREWDNRYKRQLNTQSVAAVLKENISLLPKDGLALDIACGMGANSFFLASLGMEVKAWDFSEIAINKIKGLITNGEKIFAEEIPISSDCFKEHKFDLILSCHYLDRGISKAIYDATVPGGLIIYQTFTSEMRLQTGPSNPEFLLNYRELFFLVGECEVLSYREQLIKRSDKDKMFGKAYMIARKVS
ncbi:MAG: class I SAM-dependent methyltransferase [Candidatus Azotimanducaceae bacterium]